MSGNLTGKCHAGKDSASATMSSQDTSGLSSRHGRAVPDSEERQSRSLETSARHSASSPPPPAGNGGAAPNVAAASSSHRSIAQQNEGLKGIKEDPSNLATWDAWSYHAMKLWSAFGNWNNRQVLKNITASPAVLRTYHDSFLFGEVPMSVKARATLRTGVIGIIWNVVNFFPRSSLKSDRMSQSLLVCLLFLEFGKLVNVNSGLVGRGLFSVPVTVSIGITLKLWHSSKLLLAQRVTACSYATRRYSNKVTCRKVRHSFAVISYKQMGRISTVFWLQSTELDIYWGGSFGACFCNLIQSEPLRSFPRTSAKSFT